MQKCFIFLCFTKLCSCVELYSPKKLLATSLGDPNCSTISSYLRAVGCSDSNSDSRFFKDDSISFFSFSLQHSCLESSFKYVLMALFFKMYLPIANEIFDFISICSIIGNTKFFKGRSRSTRISCFYNIIVLRKRALINRIHLM